MGIIILKQLFLLLELVIIKKQNRIHYSWIWLELEPRGH